MGPDLHVLLRLHPNTGTSCTGPNWVAGQQGIEENGMAQGCQVSSSPATQQQTMPVSNCFKPPFASPRQDTHYPLGRVQACALNV